MNTAQETSLFKEISLEGGSQESLKTAPSSSSQLVSPASGPIVQVEPSNQPIHIPRNPNDKSHGLQSTRTDLSVVKQCDLDAGKASSVCREAVSRKKRPLEAINDEDMVIGEPQLIEVK